MTEYPDIMNIMSLLQLGDVQLQSECKMVHYPP